MKRLIAKTSAALATVAALPYAARAQFGNSLNKLEGVGKASGYDTDATGKGNLLILIGGIVKALIGLTGIILVVYMIYAGFLWMTAQGDSKKVDTAKTIIKNGVIGLVIIVLSYGITSFVLTKIDGLDASPGSPAPSGQSVPPNAG